MSNIISLSTSEEEREYRKEKSGTELSADSEFIAGKLRHKMQYMLLCEYANRTSIPVSISIEIAVAPFDMGRGKFMEMIDSGEIPLTYTRVGENRNARYKFDIFNVQDAYKAWALKNSHNLTPTLHG